jgi:hypothetical protein
VDHVDAKDQVEPAGGHLAQRPEGARLLNSPLVEREEEGVADRAPVHLPKRAVRVVVALLAPRAGAVAVVAVRALRRQALGARVGGAPGEGRPSGAAGPPREPEVLPDKVPGVNCPEREREDEGEGTWG